VNVSTPFDRRPDPADLVRCLQCRTVYALPRRVDDAEAGRDCPKCGYVGWLAVSIPHGQGFSGLSGGGPSAHAPHAPLF